MALAIMIVSRLDRDDARGRYWATPRASGFAFRGSFSSRCAAMNANAAETVACCTRSSRWTRSTKSMFE